MQKDCKAEGIEIPKNIMAKDPVTHMLTPQEYLRKVEAGAMPPMDNHQMMKEMAESATTLDAEPSASAADEETYIKIPSCRYAANCDAKKQHPTGAVAPTCRREYGLVNGIPAGYETDDSWDNDSHTHEHTHMHNIVPLLSICPWNNRPHRGREQPHGQHNNINVRTGHAPYS